MAMIDWRDLSPSDLLDRYECLSLEQTAFVLNLVYRRGPHKGEPNPYAVRELLVAGKLRLLDPDQRRSHWTISAPVVRHYADTGQAMPRRRPDLHGVAS